MQETKPIGKQDSQTPLSSSLTCVESFGSERDLWFEDDTQSECHQAAKNDYERWFRLTCINSKCTTKNIFLFLEDPHSSKGANIYGRFMLVIVIIGTLSLVLQSVEVIIQHTEKMFLAFDMIVLAIFTVDYVGRLLTCPRMYTFVIQVSNIIDLLSVVPTYIEIILIMASSYTGKTNLAALRVLKLMRVFRLFSLGKRSMMFRILYRALYNVRDGAWFLCLIVSLLVIFFSACMYYLETASCNLHEDQWIYDYGQYDGTPTFFQDIPVTFWWAIVTLSTVGYGDAYPVTILGKILASIAMLSAIVLIAFPINILGHTFQEAADEYKAHLYDQNIKRNITALTTNRNIDTIVDTSTGNPHTLSSISEMNSQIEESEIQALDTVTKELEILRKAVRDKEKEQRRIVNQTLLNWNRTSSRTNAQNDQLECTRSSITLETPLQTGALDAARGKLPKISDKEDTSYNDVSTEQFSTTDTASGMPKTVPIFNPNLNSQ